MKKKHLKLISIALAASLCTMSSCVDNDYDLNEDIDLTISVGGEEFAIPGGQTEAIKLSKILKVEEGDLVKIRENGDYYLLQAGDPSSTEIQVDGFSIVSPPIPLINSTLTFYNIPNLFTTRAQGVELVASLPKDKHKTDFILTADLPKDVKSLSHIDVNIDAKLKFSFTTGITNALNLKDITIDFPNYILSDVLVDGKMLIKDKEVTNDKSIEINVPIKGINIDPKNIENGKLKIEGTIFLNGKVSTNTGDLLITQLPVGVELYVEVTLNKIDVKGVTGIVKPEIKFDVNPITLNNLPDFLSDEEVQLDVTNPMIFFTANNQTPVEASITGTVASIYKENPNNNVSVDFAIPNILANLDQKFCLSPENPDSVGVQWISAPTLPSLVTKIPKEIQIKINAEASNESTTIDLNQNYSIQTDYSITVPFMFGQNLTIVYKDTIDGWRGDLEDYEIKAVNATGSVINKVPLNLILTATAITTDAKDQPMELKGVTAVVKVNGEENGIIKAGDLETGFTTPIVIEIKETIAGSIKKLDGLALRAVADSKGTVNGHLNENQTIQLINVKLKVPGGLKIDLNK